MTGFNPVSTFFVVCKGGNNVAAMDCRWSESVIPLSNLDVFLLLWGLLELFSTSRCGILVASSPVLCAEVMLCSSVFALLASPVVLSIHIMGVSPQIPASSWSLYMAYVTPASLTWRLRHEGGFRWTHPDPSLCAAALSVSFTLTPPVLQYPTDIFNNDVMEFSFDRW